jgi:hypothetical protein
MNRYIRGKVVDLEAVMTGRKNAEELHKTVATREELANLHPAHAIYFEAYVNHRSDVIFLAGLPDVAESRPHSTVNSE